MPRSDGTANVRAASRGTRRPAGAATLVPQRCCRGERGGDQAWAGVATECASTRRGGPVPRAPPAPSVGAHRGTTSSGAVVPEDRARSRGPVRSGETEAGWQARTPRPARAVLEARRSLGLRCEGQVCGARPHDSAWCRWLGGLPPEARSGATGAGRLRVCLGGGSAVAPEPMSRHAGFSRRRSPRAGAHGPRGRVHARTGPRARRVPRAVGRTAGRSRAARGGGSYRRRARAAARRGGADRDLGMECRARRGRCRLGRRSGAPATSTGRRASPWRVAGGLSARLGRSPIGPASAQRHGRVRGRSVGGGTPASAVPGSRAGGPCPSSGGVVWTRSRS